MATTVLIELRQQASQLSVSLSTEEACAKLSENVPASFSISELLNLTKDPSSEKNPLSTLLAIAACTQHLDRLRAEPEDSSTPSNLADWIASSVTPIDNRQPSADDSYGPPDDPLPRITTSLLPLIPPSITALHALIQHFSPSPQPLSLSPSTIITLISLSDAHQPWSTPPTASLAADLVSYHLTNLSESKSDFISTTLLTTYLKPLFSRSRPAGVTPSGRLAAFPSSDPLTHVPGLSDDSPLTKPWKYTDLRAIPVLSWCISSTDESDIAWHLYVPPLLTLLDDPLTRVRVSGLRLAAAFLDKLPANKLKATGLGSVFEDAIFPTLGYLPSLTPEGESVELLGPGYEALLVLAGKLAVDGPEGEGKGREKRGVGRRKGEDERRRLLDKIMRGGILMGYFHCPEHPAIVEVLMREMGRVVSALGVASVKRLKDMAPVLKAVITEPFASARPDTLREGVRALQKVVENCWPRLVEGVWTEEVLGILVLGWVGLVDGAEKGEPGSVREELRKATAMLAAVMKTGGVDLDKKVEPLVEKEPSLAELFTYEDAAPRTLNPDLPVDTKPEE